MAKIIGYEDSKDAAYELDGKVYSAYQRNEVVRRYEYDDGKVAFVVLRHWGKKEREEQNEADRLNKIRLQKEYDEGRIGDKWARILGLKKK